MKKSSFQKVMHAIQKNRPLAVIGYLTVFSVATGIAGLLSILIFHTHNIINTQTSTGVYCTRTDPYPMPPEFRRALSLIGERAYQANQQAMVTPTQLARKNYLNCLDIQYANLSNQNAEGIFLFDNNSTPNDLKIYVDNSYQGYDDYLTAILLAHEITHAYQFDEKAIDGISTSCMQSEIQAFENERTFMADLNNEEKLSLVDRILSNPSKNGAYSGIYELMLISKQAADECGHAAQCYNDSVDQQITAMVENSPYYQQECGITPAQGAQ